MNATNNATAILGIFLQSQLQLEKWRLSFYLLCKLGLCSCEHRSKNHNQHMSPVPTAINIKLQSGYIPLMPTLIKSLEVKLLFIL